HHQVVAAAPRALEPFAEGAGHVGVHAAPPEQPLERQRVRLFVVDDQGMEFHLGPFETRHIRSYGTAASPVSLSYWELDHNAGAAAAALQEADAAAVLVDDLLRDREAEAGAARLGREEGIEHAAARRVGDAGPAIGDGEHHVGAEHARLALDHA